MTYDGAVHDDALEHLPPRKVRPMGTVHLPQPILGEVAWWQVLEPTMVFSEVAGLCHRHRMGDPPPAPQLHYVFRRLTGAGVKEEYDLGPRLAVRLDVHPVPSKVPHLVRRDVVRTLRRSRTVDSIDKVGTLVANKRSGEIDLGVEEPVRKLPDRRQVEEFILGIRKACETAMQEVHAQAGRRLVRQYLASRHALLLEGGPYFIPSEEDAEGLMTLLAELGGSTGFHTPFIDGDRQRQLIVSTLAKAGDLPEKTHDIYKALLGRQGGTP